MEISELYSIFKSHPQVTTDSRDCPKGSIFFALKGASFNGNTFAEKALAQGCSYAVVDEKEYYKENDGRYILTDDCLSTLQKLANYHRRQLGTKIISITGTNGKTTTKELIAAVLSEKFDVLYTQGNFNNHIGVPKTLLRMTEKNDIAVIEMGANHLGEIKQLVDIVEPDYGIITNVGMAHLKGFGSFEGVVRTKGELYDYLRAHNGTAFIHNENKHLIGISDGIKLIKYGCEGAEDLLVCGKVITCNPFLNFKWQQGCGEWHITKTHLIGSYNVFNMLAAACIGIYFGVSEEQVCHALTNYIPTNNRSELETTPYNKLIIDAYNANPTSMEAALINFRDMEMDNKMAIIGDMGELGDVSGEEHQKVVNMLKASNFDEIWLVGNEFGKIPSPFPKFKDVEEVKKEIKEQRPEGHCILIKGSNAMKLFELVDLL
ncbi:MAG: UDP-N-acetylmuramoyl-tripeptide--D-alanyl-D-alanine ligase [Prevotella sp.]|nr:UDP-N-acetylmuramoyl-tripeptide--D-alanyl-D-alanine ligase [Prevotella sp.]